MDFSRLVGAGLMLGACSPDPVSLVGDGAADMAPSTSSSFPAGSSSGDDSASASSSPADSATEGSSSSETGAQSSSSSSGGSMGEQCYPEALHGKQITRAESGWTLYEGCEDGQFVLQPDADPSLPVATYGPLELLGAPGIYGSGTGLCCDGAEVCENLFLHRWDATAQDVLAYFDETYAGLQTGCTAFHIEITGLTEPRCAADDPDCLPQACIEGTVYDPALPRTPVAYGIQEGTCSHDGECVREGIHCRGWQERQDGVAAKCGLEGGLCGCVESECRFFTQE